MNDFIISNMSIEHIDDVIKVEELSFKTPWSREALEFEVERNKCAKYRVMLRDGRVIAYGGMWIMLDEAHITNIAVHPEYRGFGCGSHLLEDMIEVARENGIKSMTLEVRVNNEAALALYKKYGFTDVAIRKGYYQDTGEDAIIMWKYDV